MRVKNILRAAVVAVVLLGGLAVAAPAQAATCTTREPVRVGSQIRYSLAVRGTVPAGARYYVRARWFAFSSTTYSATVPTFRRNYHDVYEAAGWIVRANGSRLATCRVWRADEI